MGRGSSQLLSSSICSEELWQHASHFDWNANSFYQHIWFLFDTFVSTKESLEDCLGSLSSLAKAQNRNPFKQSSPEKILFNHSRFIRWSEEFPTLKLQLGDMCNRTFFSHPSGRIDTFTIHSITSQMESQAIAAVERAIAKNTPGNMA